jgi:DNA-binding CsgD family transcriptional regulator
MLVGRERELRALQHLVVGVREHGAALVVRGEAGIGKSTLVAAASEHARADGFMVLTATGVKSEAHLPFAGLHQLVQPILGAADALPARQRDALLGAFGMSDASPLDAFLIALAALQLLAEAAGDAPLLVIVEDAQWLDRPSADVLAFVARRLELEPIAVLLVVRDGHVTPLTELGLPELLVEALDDEAAAALLDAHAPDLTPALRTRVLAEAAGNPLAVVELPRSVGAAGVRAAVDMAPAPITERLARAFSGRASELPQAARTLLLVASLDEGGGLRAALDAASQIEGRAVTLDDLALAEAARLVIADGIALRFRHPLVPAAISHAATTSARRAAHAALADAHVMDPDRGLWHRAASLDGPDEQVAKDLEVAANRALQRGAPQSAAQALEQAAEVTADPARRGALLVRAAEMEFELGRSDVSARLLAEARTLDLDRHERARLAFLTEVMGDANWSAATKVASLVDIAEQLTALGEPERALHTLLTVGLRCWWGHPDDTTRAAVVTAAERLRRPEGDPAVLTVLAYADPVGRGAFVIDRISQVTPDSSDPRAMLLLGSAATAVWAHDLSLPFLEIAVDGLRAQGRLGLLAQALVTQSWAAVHCAREPLAISAAEEGARLSRETGQARWAVAARLAQAMIASERGEFPVAEAIAREAEAELLPMGANSMLSLVQFVRGRGAVAHQHYAEGLDHLEPMLDPAAPAYHPFVGAWALSDLVEAAAHIGRRDRAVSYLTQLESLAEATSGSLLKAAAGYARPMVADDDGAESLYQHALQRDLTDWPCYRGRMLLRYGRWLRRQRRVAESRAPLRAARDSFDALAFPELAERARQELRASGETSRRRSPEAWDQLTPQELRIGQMAAAGLSNREIGERLYLSHRTVGSHLHNMFPKLGITSRAQLRDALQGAALV